jgi:hypothetical protein
MELQRYTFVLLRRPADAPDLPDEELEALQQGYLAHLRAMHERGALAVAGPFDGQPDESLRGFCLYRTDVDETRPRRAGPVDAGRAHGGGRLLVVDGEGRGQLRSLNAKWK